LRLSGCPVRHSGAAQSANADAANNATGNQLKRIPANDAASGFFKDPVAVIGRIAALADAGWRWRRRAAGDDHR